MLADFIASRGGSLAALLLKGQQCFWCPCVPMCLSWPDSQEEVHSCARLCQCGIRPPTMAVTPSTGPSVWPRSLTISLFFGSYFLFLSGGLSLHPVLSFPPSSLSGIQGCQNDPDTLQTLSQGPSRASLVGRGHRSSGWGSTQQEGRRKTTQL